MEQSLVRVLLPRGTEYIADFAFEIAPVFYISPYLILGITYAESNFGLALKPPGPSGTGDFIPRPATPSLDALMAAHPMPETIRQSVPNIPSRNINAPTMAWVPTTRGWGHGLYQLDWVSHHTFLETGKWSDPREAMKYALQLLTNDMKSIQAATRITGPALVRAGVAAYNAGATRVISAIKAAKAVDTVTFSPGYVAKIETMANKLASTGKQASGVSGLVY